MAYYESVFIARQDISAAQVEGLTENFTKVISDHDGKIAGTESWGLRALAYKIKKNRKGHYVLMNIDAPSNAIHEMERQMRINEDVLRYMTIKVDELENEPSIIMRNAQRDDRPRRPSGNDRPPPAAAPEKTEAPEADVKDAPAEAAPAEAAPAEAAAPADDASKGEDA
ncbi:MAG: 30S ribosomal protein S6 [Rhodospirillaceae bacterium]|nr:30S ribosomal protein S6 [Rhodospirillaceae bacterium]MBT7356079.1 30S ribosomal protein S6 [Rhodospirillaceae bacterium]